MKKLTLLFALAAFAMPQAAQADVVVGWDTWDSSTAPTSTVSSPGVTAIAAASASTGNWAAGEGGGNAGRGSSGDTTWGTFDGAGSPASGSTTVQADNLLVANGRPSAEITFTITNGGATDLELGAFHMDVLRWRPNAANAYELSVLSGDLTIGSVFASGADALTNHGGASLAARDLHDDIDISFASLADRTLAAGEEAVIQIEFTGGTGSGGGHHLFLDNVAFSSATAIPEPSSLAMLGLAGLGMFVRRKRS